KTVQGSEPITGKVGCQVATSGNGKYALRLGYYAGGNTGMSFHFLDSLPKDPDSFSFKFGSGSGKDGKPYTGPLVFFMDLVTVAEEGGNVKITVHSNTVAKMVSVK